MVEIGVIHGRFQGLHLKHMEYILAAKMRCKRLYIGITSPEDSYLAKSSNRLNKAKIAANPFTYIERYEMLRDALEEFGVARDAFDIIPFPLTKPESLLQYTPQDAVYFLGICDSWSEDNKKVLEGLGFRTEVIWQKSPEEKGITGAEVREKIITGQEWKSLVPKTVYQYIVKRNLDERVKRLVGEKRVTRKRLEKLEEKQ